MVPDLCEMIAFDMIEFAALGAQAMEAMFVAAVVFLSDVFEASRATLVDDVLADETIFDKSFELTVNRGGTDLDAVLPEPAAELLG